MNVFRTRFFYDAALYTLAFYFDSLLTVSTKWMRLFIKHSPFAAYRFFFLFCAFFDV